MARNCRYFPMSKQPLVLVLCQVRMSPISKIPEYLPGIQEAFRRNGFPIEMTRKDQALVIGPEGLLGSTTNDAWEYRNKDENWSIIVTRESIVLQTTAYEKFEGFAENLKLALKVVLSVTEHDKFGVIGRIGLRYIDLIQPREGEDHRKYLLPGFHGIGEGVYEAGSGRTMVECLGRTDLGDGAHGTLAVRIWQNNKGMDLPPDLVANSPKRDQRSKISELVTIIDTDHWIVGKLDPDPQVIIDVTYRLHDQIIEIFHDRVITAEAREVWK